MTTKEELKSHPEIIPNEKEDAKNKAFILALELMKDQKIFPFAGVDAISPRVYESAKAQEEQLKDYPEFMKRATLIDDLLKKFAANGMTITLGPHGLDGNIMIEPGNNNDPEHTLNPRVLKITKGMDKTLKDLILACRKYDRLKS